MSSDDARRLFEIRREQWFRQCRRDFLSFCTEVMSRQGREPAAHHRLMIALLQEAANGKLLQLILAAPPGCGKSTYISYLYAAWYLSAHPNAQILACAHTESLAISNSVAVQRIVSEHTDVLGFGAATEAAADWRTTTGGRYRAVGVGTAATGYRASLILIDDPVKGVEAAHSETDRNRVYEWYRQDIYTRRTPGCPIIIVQTRWHEDDLSGRLLLLEPDDWRHVRLAAISEGDGDPLNRLEGEPLWSDDSTYGYAQDLLRLRGVLEKSGQTAMWWALYQGTPRPPEGNLFKIDKIETRDQLSTAINRTIRAWDFASTTQGDYTVGLKLVVQYDHEFKPFWIITDVQRFRGGPEEVRRTVRQIAESDGYGTQIALPEDPGQAGKSQVFDFTQLLSGFPLVATRMTGSKEIRALSVAAQVNIGKVHMLKANWNAALLDELAGFPSAKYDDQVDALSLAFSELATHDLSVWLRM
jgi:predicted phage terminase large subunit-like protein